MEISSDFDSGNIALVEMQGDDIQLRIEDDAGGQWRQWFNFRLLGASDRQVKLDIVNAGEVSYKSGFENYQAVALDEGEKVWRRVETSFDGRTLCIRLQPKSDNCQIAYFAPYPYSRHCELIERVKAYPHVTHSVLGQSLDGRDMDLLTICKDDQADKRPIWFIARQHAGESMAEWWMEGFLARFADDGNDPVVEDLLREAVFYVVPNMNPDGVYRGHLRANAAGQDLNRAWAEPDPAKAPEVALVRAKMHETGVDFALDVHGDEALPYVFLTGMKGIPSLTEIQSRNLEAYSQALLAESPDFQIEKGYPPTPPGKANLAIGSSYIAETFDCVALTLEQPFKDNANLPDAYEGWSPDRSAKMGSACLNALAQVIDDL